jgi:hypothetical protein
MFTALAMFEEIGGCRALAPVEGRSGILSGKIRRLRGVEPLIVVGCGRREAIEARVIAKVGATKWAGVFSDPTDAISAD